MIDTHAHLASAQLLNDVERYVTLAEEAGVRGILCVGTTAEDSAKCIEIASRFSSVRAAVGIHPNNCHEAAEGDWKLIEAMARDPRVVAIGETGLDRYWKDCPWETQLHYLSLHIQLARELDLPIVIHTRDCVDEAIDWLEAQYKSQPFSAVMHSFTGSVSAARRCLDIGFYISFAGMVTFKNGEDIRQVAADVPLDRLLVETDSPYLTPHPFRGQKPNHPALVQHTLECISSLRGLSPQELSAIEADNAKRLFRKW